MAQQRSVNSTVATLADGNKVEGGKKEEMRASKVFFPPPPLHALQTTHGHAGWAVKFPAIIRWTFM